MNGLLEYKTRREAVLSEKARDEFYEKFLVVKATEKRGLTIKFNDEAVSKYRAQHVGVFVLISNHGRLEQTAVAVQKFFKI